jgi:tetratricopeptide (TPR) repeat protein
MADGGEGRLIATATLMDAATAYEEALDLGADPYATGFWAAEARERTGNRAKALAAIRKALAARPNDPAAAAMKGRLLIDEGQSPEAAAVLDAALAANPKAAEAGELAFQAMRARLKIGDRQSLPQQFAKLTRGDPHGAAARIYPLVAAEFRGTRDEDLWTSLLEAEGKASPDDPVVLFWRAELAARRKDGAATVALADRYRAARPSDPDGRVLKALGLRLLGRLDEARAEIGKAYDLEPGRQTTGEEMRYLVAAFYEARRYKEAADVQELVAHVTSSPADRYDHAVLLLDSGDVTAAKAVYRKLFEDQDAPRSENSRAANALALLFSGQGDPKKAEEWYRKAIESDPDGSNLDAHENLGILLIRTGRPEEGMKELREAISRSPKSDPPRKRALYHLWRAEHPEVP